jgi:hypothetical protein
MNLDSLLQYIAANRSIHYETIKAHCEAGIRTSDDSGRLLVGCGNVERTVSIVLSAMHEMKSPAIREMLANSRYSFDGFVADMTCAQIIANFSRDEAWCIVKAAAKGILKRVREDHPSPFMRFFGSFWGKPEDEPIDKEIPHRAKIVLFMTAYSFLAEMYLDKDGKLK